jgi:hypothetical protein
MTAVQVVWSSRRGQREIEHLGSAHGKAELEALKVAAQQRIAAGQMELDLDLGAAGRRRMRRSAALACLCTDAVPTNRHSRQAGHVGMLTPPQIR